MHKILSRVLLTLPVPKMSYAHVNPLPPPLQLPEPHHPAAGAYLPAFVGCVNGSKLASLAMLLNISTIMYYFVLNEFTLNIRDSKAYVQNFRIALFLIRICTRLSALSYFFLPCFYLNICLRFTS